MVCLAPGMDRHGLDQSRCRRRCAGLVGWRLDFDHHLGPVDAEQQQESESGAARTGRCGGRRRRADLDQVFEEQESIRSGQGSRHHAILLLVAARIKQRRPSGRRGQRGQRAVAGEGVGRTELSIRGCQSGGWWRGVFI